MTESWLHPHCVFFLCEQKLNDESILRSQLDMKTPHHSVSGRSYLASSPDSSNVAVFEVSLSCLASSPSCFTVLGFTVLGCPVHVAGRLGLAEEMPHWSGVQRQQQH